MGIERSTSFTYAHTLYALLGVRIWGRGLGDQVRIGSGAGVYGSLTLVLF